VAESVAGSRHGGHRRRHALDPKTHAEKHVKKGEAIFCLAICCEYGDGIVQKTAI